MGGRKTGERAVQVLGRRGRAGGQAARAAVGWDGISTHLHLICNEPHGAKGSDDDDGGEEGHRDRRREADDSDGHEHVEEEQEQRVNLDEGEWHRHLFHLNGLVLRGTPHKAHRG